MSFEKVYELSSYDYCRFLCVLHVSILGGRNPLSGVTSSALHQRKPNSAVLRSATVCIVPVKWPLNNVVHIRHQLQMVQFLSLGVSTSYEQWSRKEGNDSL